MQDTKQAIKEVLIQKIKSLQKTGEWPDFELPTFVVERPKEYNHGDYTVNLGFTLAKYVQKKPAEITDLLVQNLSIMHVKEIAAVGGYINFVCSDKIRVKEMRTVCKEAENYGNHKTHKGKKILVEHTSPNLFKPFHIGHLVNNTVGESIVRLMKKTGGTVETMSYPSDMSLGIAKAVWAILGSKKQILEDESLDIYKKIQFLGECYVKGTRSYDADDEVKKKIREINHEIYAGEKTDAVRAYLIGKELSLSYLKEMTHRLDSKIDHFIFESAAGNIGQEIVKKHTNTIFNQSDGAIIYNGEKEGLHTRVFVNAQGLPTYEAKDIGLLALKFTQHNPDMSVIVTDAEQAEYYKVVLAAAAKIEAFWSQKTQHITHGRLQFAGIKISSRLGNVPLAEDVIEKIANGIHKKMRESKKTQENIPQNTIDAIAIGALKFAVLKVSLGKNIVFDAKESLSFEGDSGPYLQYTHARTQSIIVKAQNMGLDIVPGYEEDMQEIFFLISLFPETITKATNDCAPHLVANYLLELAHAYNTFYANKKILGSSEKHGARVAMTEAVGHVVKNGLHVLGISAPQKM